MKDPFQAVSDIFSSSDYSSSLEAQNRDSLKLIAEQFNMKRPNGLLVFLSAEPSIIPLPSFEKYARTKREAEDFLREYCTATNTIVIRPGLVYS